MKATLHRALPNGDYIEVVARYDDGYFSLTGSLWEKRGRVPGASRARMGRDADASGQITDEALSAFPQLAPIAALHLSDANSGQPMHAVANGWYFYSGKAEAHEREHYGESYIERYGTGYERACRLLRVASIPEGLGQDGFTKFANQQRERWRREADEGRALIDSVDLGKE